MITASIVLIASLVLLYVGIASLGQLLIDVISFWGRVIYKDPSEVSWSFRFSGTGLGCFVVGLAGTLWSVIVLAIKFAA